MPGQEVQNFAKEPVDQPNQRDENCQDFKIFFQNKSAHFFIGNKNGHQKHKPAESSFEFFPIDKPV
jgi:hypothetical protein